MFSGFRLSFDKLTVMPTFVDQFERLKSLIYYSIQTHQEIFSNPLQDDGNVNKNTHIVYNATFFSLLRFMF